METPDKGKWRGTLVFSMIFARTDGWINNRDVDDLNRHRAHYDATVMINVEGNHTAVPVPMK